MGGLEERGGLERQLGWTQRDPGTRSGTGELLDGWNWLEGQGPSWLLAGEMDGKGQDWRPRGGQRPRPEPRCGRNKGANSWELLKLWPEPLLYLPGISPPGQLLTHAHLDLENSGLPSRLGS